MISLSKNGDAIRFIFTNSDHYLYGNGYIDVPPNSLSLILNNSGDITFYKAASNDIFVSAPYEEWDKTPAEIEEFYKTSMVSEGGGSAIKELYLGTAYDTVNQDTCEVTKYEVGDIVSGHTITDDDFHYLIYVYTNDNQECSLTAVDMDNYITENEFRSGTTVVNHVVRGVVDPRTEKVYTAYDASGNPSSSASVLSVNISGFTVNNIQNAIDERCRMTVKKVEKQTKYEWDAASQKMKMKFYDEDGNEIKDLDIFDTNSIGEILLLNRTF